MSAQAFTHFSLTARCRDTAHVVSSTSPWKPASHYNRIAPTYAAFRPQYPPTLFHYLRSLCPPHSTHAWDCGTGNGQAAVALAHHFERVTATDASEAQLQNATRHQNVRYRQARAEDVGKELEDGSVDLVTAACAVHWFDKERFYREARRVLRGGGVGVIAVWTFGIMEVEGSESVRRVFEDLLRALEPWWPSGRLLRDGGYEDLHFPFREVRPVPDFSFRTDMQYEALTSLVETFSAVGRYRADDANAGGSTDPVETFTQHLTQAWPTSGAGQRMPVRVRLPIILRVGRDS